MPLYLKYFIDAAESNSVSESAKKNFVTQSCVSQGIKKLEQTLKVDLTMHLRNRFKLRCRLRHTICILPI